MYILLKLITTVKLLIVMNPKSLEEQIDCVRCHSFEEFCRYIDEFTLKSKAISELYKPRICEGPEKFEAYIRKYGRLKLEDERRLLETHRKDLQEIYFRYCSCDERNEQLVVQNANLSRLYYKFGHCPGINAQKYLAKANSKATYRFIKLFEFCDEAFKCFTGTADKRMKCCYGSFHPAAYSDAAL